MAARRAHRRARRPLLPAGDPRLHGPRLREPARDRRLPAAGAPDLVLRRAEDLGEAEGGRSRRSWRRSRARTARTPARASRPRSRRSASSRRARRSRSRSPPRPRPPTRRCSATCGSRSASTRRSRSTSARRRRRSRCSSSSTRSGSRSASSGGCRRPAARAPSTRPIGSSWARSARPLPGIEIKLAEDGEVLVRGDSIMPGYRNMPEKTAETIDCRGLARDRRHRRARRGRLPEDRRPQEGADHQRRRQEHVAGEHRVAPEGGEPADRPGDRDRRPAALQRRADRPRPRLRAGVGEAERPRGQVRRPSSPARRS